jgi:hypothetical protein
MTNHKNKKNKNQKNIDLLEKGSSIQRQVPEKEHLKVAAELKKFILNREGC